MIKKTITYNSLFNPDEKVTEDYYFHLGKGDMVDFAVDDSFEKRMRAIMEAKDNVAIVRHFKKVIEMSVGRREGDKFIKTPEFAAAFMSSPAFDELLWEIMNSEDQGASFFASLMPADMKEPVLKELQKQQTGTDVDPFQEVPAWERENRKPTEVELRNMTREQLQAAMAKQLGSTD